MSKKCLPISKSWCSVFSSRRFIFHIEAYAPNQTNFCAWYERKTEFIFLFGLVTPARLVQSTLLFLLNCVGVLNKTYWPYGQRLYLIFYCAPQSICLCCADITLSWLPYSKFYSKSWNHALLSPPSLLLFFKMVMIISDLLNFYINFRSYLSIIFILKYFNFSI